MIKGGNNNALQATGGTNKSGNSIEGPDIVSFKK